MKTIKHSLGFGLALGTLALAFAGPAAAKPDKPVNAATTDKGTGCLVRDATGAYHFDADCKWSVVIKRDKDGALQFYKYQDKGQLPEGAPAPDKAMSWDDTPGCGGTGDTSEKTSPSGQYMSNCHFSPE